MKKVLKKLLDFVMQVEYTDLAKETIVKNFIASEGIELEVFEAVYNPCYHESSAATISIHLTEEGAQKALQFHKMEAYKEWEKQHPTKEEREQFKFGESEYWNVIKTKIQK